MTGAASAEGLLRELAPQILGAVLRRYGHFADSEDAVQAVGGLTTREIAGAFLVTEATMAQRISRAKAKVKLRLRTPRTCGARLSHDQGRRAHRRQRGPPSSSRQPTTAGETMTGRRRASTVS